MVTSFVRSVLPCVVLLPLAVCGCRRDPSEVVEEADKSVRSWAAAVEMSGDEWSRRRAPDTYLDQVLDAAREGLDEQQKSLSKVPPSDPRRVALDGRIGS